MTIYQYSATGNIFANTSESISNRIFTYSDPTIIQYSQEDFGSTSNEIISSENYGDFFSITESDDYESILTFETLIPFGTYTFSGSLIEKETDSYVGLGTLAFSGSLVDEKNTESYVGVGNIKLGLGKIYVGDNENEFSSDQITFDSIQETFDDDLLILPSALESFSAQTPEDTVLYTFSGSLIESRTYNYNELISPITNLLDYGDITEVSGELEDDFGEISQSPGLIVDFAFIVNEVEDNLLPFGKVTLSGSALYQPNYRLYIDGTALIKATYSDDVGAGTLAFSGSALEAYSAQTPEDTQLFSISGSLIEKETDSYVGLGTLAFSGSLIEKETDSYVGAGTLAFSGSALEAYSAQIPEDTVLYTFSGSALEVYSAQTPEDLVLYTFSGSALEAYSAQTPEDLVLYTFSNTPLVHPFVDYTPHYGIEKNIGIGTVGVQIFGTLIENNTGSYVGTGNLFGFGTKLESVTYDYNETSEGDPFEDYGLITDNFEFFQDYQSITSGGSVTDFGLIIDPLLVANTPFGSLTFSGSALEAYSAQTPEDLVLYTFSGSLVEKNTESYVGVGTLTFSQSAVEENTESYAGAGTLAFSGSALEAYSAQTPEDTQLFSISGQAPTNRNREFISQTLTLTLSNTPLVHPFVDYTPHYGIEKNIGIGTFGIRFVSGVGFTPDSEGNLRDARTYSNVYPGNDKVPGTGIGTFKFDETNNTAKYSPLTPYTGRGLISLSGIGLESFSITNYDGSGLISISGISSNRPISVYQGYITSGTITISQQTQPIIEKNTESYVGIGNIIKFGTLSDERIVNDYTASGTINLGKTTPTGVICSDSEQFGSSTTTFDSTLETFDVLCDSPQVIFSSALDSFSAQTPEDTVLYTFSGSALESYSAQTPEDTVLYEFAESLIERITKSYSGEGAISFSGNANESIGTNPPATGNIRFTTHLSDNLYDTCDSIDITSDYQNSAFVSFIANPPESTQLFSILGSASTNEINVYEYIGVENLTFSGSLVERETDSYAGIGTLFTLLGGSELDVNSYRGSGSLFAISGSSDSKSSQIPEDTILITISGAASTKLEFEYSYSGIGTEYITGSAITSIEPDYLYFGTGVVTLTGELVYPDIQFIPTPKGFGLFTLSGISSNSISRIGVLSGNKTLFAFSGAFESFSESTYIGLGTIYTESIVGIAISNPFQIPRTYIIII